MKGSPPRIGFYGGTGTVTGSKYLVTHPRGRVLVDCGLFQGYKQLRQRNWQGLPFTLRHLDAVALTHAHLDHSGYLPIQARNGFTGPVFCTAGTKALCEILLTDSGHLQEAEAEYLNRKNLSKHRPAKPLYTEAEARESLKLLQTVEFEEEVSAGDDATVTFFPQGHILGASGVLVKTSGTRVYFSGDLGRPDDPVMSAPTPPPKADYYVVESTYGNRLHPSMDVESMLAKEINPCLSRGGIVLIAAFAVGRTQMLLLLLRRMMESGVLPKVPVYLDSPMAISATELYPRFRHTLRLDAAEAEALKRFPICTRDVADSMALDQSDGPMIVIAASGMATGGRVIHHLKSMLGNPKNQVLFAGFQAGGTRGATLCGGAKTVRIHGEDIAVRAPVVQLDALSAHADQQQIVDWLRKAPQRPKQVFITHGEPAASDSLRQRIEHELGWNCTVPDFRDNVRLGKTR